MEKINVVFFVNSLDSGGIENYLLRFLLCSCKKFENVYIYCKSGKGGQLEKQYLLLSNVQIIKTKHGYCDILSFIRLGSFLRNKKIEVVCDFTGDFSGRTLSVAKKVGVAKRVAFYRSAENAFSPTLLKSIYSNWLNYLVRKNATDILSNSKAAFEFFYKLFWRKDQRYQVIYNGLDTKQFTEVSINLRAELHIPEDAFVVGHTGRFNQAKNHKTILHVAEKLLTKYEDIYFILCGNGVQKNLSQMSEWKKFKQRILLFENRTDIPEFLNTMDCYFFPSTREGQPNALIEAMLVGLPYIASNIDPIIETVLDLENLYPPTDIESFVDAIEKLYLKSKQQEGIVREVHQYVEQRFDADIQFGQFHSVLVSK